MYKVAVIGDTTSVLGFKALGFDVFPAEEADEARRVLAKIADGGYAVIYMTEQLAQWLAPEIDMYKDRVTPAIILIPGKDGTLGIGKAAVKNAIERAVGADIL